MIGNSQQIIQWLFQQKDLAKKFEIKEYRQKRSLNANAYCWALIGEIADVLRKSKEDVYLAMLRDYGQSEIISVRSDINIIGYFKYYEKFGTGTVNGKEFTHYKVYKGSSEFDTREMSIFIDGVIQEAQALDIQTLTPTQIAELKSLEKNKSIKI
nr:MAG TPA: NinB protein [Caudoviricetes sp.]